MEHITEKIICNGCEKTLSKVVIEMRGKPDASVWCNEGFHSLDCYRRNLNKEKESTKIQVHEEPPGTPHVSKKYPKKLILDAKIFAIIGIAINLFFMIGLIDDVVYSSFFAFMSILHIVIVSSLFRGRIELGTTLMIISAGLYLLLLLTQISNILILYSPVGLFGVIIAILIKRRL